MRAGLVALASLGAAACLDYGAGYEACVSAGRCSDDAGATAGGRAGGTATAGGASGGTAGGSTAGGTAGGSTAGGSTAGGSTAGGSTAGGSTAGGSTAGGAAGGSSLLTLNFIGPGQGTVTITGGPTCTSSCTAQLPANSRTLNASAGSSSVFQAWSSPCSSSSTLCLVDLSAGNLTLSVTFNTSDNVAFVSSTKQAAMNLGGTSGADSLCQRLADDAGITSVDGGARHFRAWLTTADAGTDLRFAGVGGWRRVDGLPFAPDTPGLDNRTIYYPLRLDEHGAVVANDEHVPTGMGYFGQTTGDTCADWTADSGTVPAGSVGSAADRWAFYAYVSCAEPAHVYCMSTDSSAGVGVPPPPPGVRLMFLSDYTWAVDGGGIASADAYCDAQAIGNGLDAGFRALLAPTGARASSRFNLTGSPWYRLDGVQVWRVATDLASATAPLLAAPNVTPTFYYSNDTVWTGATDPASNGVGIFNCSDWTNGATATGELGLSTFATPKYFNGAVSAGCASSGRPVYCLQQ